MEFFDAHTHIHFRGYGGGQENVFLRAKATGVKMIAVGTQYSTSLEALKFAESHAGDVWATVGFHPSHFLEDWYHDKNEQENSEREKFDISKLRKMAINSKVVAIGECGLDYFRQHSAEDEKNQKDGFLAQIELAKEVKKPLMIHCRAAFGDLISILSDMRSSLSDLPYPGAVHFFTGTKEDAQELLDLGFVFTFGGVITFSRDYDEVIKYIPTDKILSETDAPYVAPAPYRGKQNEPAYVVAVVKRLAEIKGIDLVKAASIFSENAKRVFGI